MSKQRYRELNFEPWSLFDDVVNELLDARKRGEHVYVNFNGKKLKSNFIKTVDDAYLYMYGCSKEEMKKRGLLVNKSVIEIEDKLNKFYQSYNRNLLVRLRGSIDPDIWMKLENIFLDSLESAYSGKLFSDLLGLVTLLSKSSDFNDAYRLFKEQGHSAFSESYVLGEIESLLPNGIDFSNYVIALSREEQDTLEEKVKRLF